MRGHKVLEEVGRHIEVVLDDDNKLVAEIKDRVQRPSVMPGDLVIPLEFLLLRRHHNVRQVGLLDQRHIVAVREDHLFRGLVAAVLEESGAEQCKSHQ